MISPHDPLLSASARSFARMVREKRISPVELVDAFIARIEAENPAINAVVAERFERARGEAREAEARVVHTRADEPLPPLLGVPCTVKECIAVEGMPNTAGVYARKGLCAPRDADVVRRTRNAGAIVLGVTNMPEGGLWLETNNRIYGRTNNPWDPTRIPGGSSGGEGAILAVEASPFGIGADIGGSIRIPAAFCGVFGHKPTGGLVSNEGYWPAVPGALDVFLCTGPMTRRAEDLWPLVSVMAQRPPEGRPEEVDLCDVTVYPLETGAARVREGQRQAVRRAARALEVRGARIRPLQTRGFERALEIWSAMMEEEAGALSYAEVLGNGRAISLPRELLRCSLPEAPHTLQALVVAAAEAILKWVPAPLATWSLAGKRLREELEAELGPRGVILHPPYTRAAPRHFEPLLTPFDFVCTAIFNVLGFPVTEVPAGRDASGLPLGVQVAARRGGDALTIAIAGALEEELGGFSRARPSRAAKGRTTPARP
jgi:fatty acid amide hydrolase 2